jgi:hypothetical protein
VVGLVLREDDVASVAALVKGLEDCRHVVGGVVSAWKDGASGAPILLSYRDMMCCRLGYYGQVEQSEDRVRGHFVGLRRVAYQVRKIPMSCPVCSIELNIWVQGTNTSCTRPQIGNVRAFCLIPRLLRRRRARIQLRVRLGGSQPEPFVHTVPSSQLPLSVRQG